jgi:Ca2+/Na+ antiporter
MVVFTYRRDLRSKTLVNLMNRNPHLAHIIASNPGITEADIAALDEQHKAGLLTSVPSLEHFPLLRDEENSLEEIEDIEAIQPASINTFNRILAYIHDLFSSPWVKLFSMLFPSLKDGEYIPLGVVSTVLGVSIVCISVFASLIVAISQSMVETLDIGSSTMGATLVALGAEVSSVGHYVPAGSGD